MPAQARVGDDAHCPSDGHGCLACNHPVTGPCTQGSPDVYVNGLPAERKGDPGVHSSCCGANTWIAEGCSSTVFINGLGAHRLDDQTIHCGGEGTTIMASPDVFVGG